MCPDNSREMKMPVQASGVLLNSLPDFCFRDVLDLSHCPQRVHKVARLVPLLGRWPEHGRVCLQEEAGKRELFEELLLLAGASDRWRD